MGLGTTSHTTGRPPASGTEEKIAGLGGKYLAFFLGGEEYGLQILRVREIIGLVDITPVPQTPDFIRGVINLRGKIIPIVDLRQRFGMPSAETTRETCIVVVRTHGIDTGIVVDKMSEVLDVDGKDIEEPPSLGSGVSTEFILGIDKSEGRVKLLINIQKVLSGGELDQVATAACSAAN